MITPGWYVPLSVVAISLVDIFTAFIIMLIFSFPRGSKAEKRLFITMIIYVLIHAVITVWALKGKELVWILAH